MWKLLVTIFNNQKATALSRGAMLAFSMMGVIFLPLAWWSGQAAYDEFQSTRLELKQVIGSLNDVTSSLKIATERGIDRDRRMEQMEFTNRKEYEALSLHAERLSALEGILHYSAPFPKR